MKIAAVVSVALALAGGAFWQQLPGIGAGALLHPSRQTDRPAPPAGCVHREFDGVGVTFRGWVCEPDKPARGSIVYLHGIADHRDSAAGVIARFRPAGFRVVPARMSGSYRSRNTSRGNANFAATESMTLIWQV